MKQLPKILMALGMVCLAGIGNANAGEVGDTISVVATGVGTDGDSALKNAYRAAVEQAVGFMVDAETLVDSGDVVSDKILSFSAGFVQSYVPLGEPKGLDGGLVSVRIRAEVKRNVLSEELKKARVTRVHVDGRSLSAEAITKVASREDGIDMMEKMMQDFHSSVMTTSLAEPPRWDIDAKKMVLRVTTKLDQEKYATFAKEFTDLLIKLGAQRKVSNANLALERVQDISSRDGYSGPAIKMTVKGKIVTREPDPQPNRLMIIDNWPNLSRVGQEGVSSFSIYVIPRDVYKVVHPFFNWKRLVATAIDANEKTLATSRTWSPMPYSSARFIRRYDGTDMYRLDLEDRDDTANDRDTVFFMPSLRFRDDGYRIPIISPGVAGWTDTISMDIPMENLDQISTVHFSYE